MSRILDKMYSLGSQAFLLPEPLAPLEWLELVPPREARPNSQAPGDAPHPRQTADVAQPALAREGEVDHGSNQRLHLTDLEQTGRESADYKTSPQQDPSIATRKSHRFFAYLPWPHFRKFFMRCIALFLIANLLFIAHVSIFGYIENIPAGYAALARALYLNLRHGPFAECSTYDDGSMECGPDRTP